jgi:hypothetical protein
MEAPPDDVTPPLLRLCAGLGGASLVLYVVTLAPTFGWGDSADLALRMVVGDDPMFAGSSRDYVLYRAVAGVFQALPFGDAGYRANLATGAFGAVAVGLVAFLCGSLTRSRLAAAGAAASLAVSHTFWLLSVTAEVYTFQLALVYGALAALLAWTRTGSTPALVGAAACAGASLSHHASTLVLLASMAPAVWLARRHLRPLPALASVAVLLGTSVLYVERVSADLAKGRTLLRALGLTTPGNPFYDAAPLKEAVKFVGYTGYNFAGAAGLLAVLGLVTVVRRRDVAWLACVVWGVLLVGAGVGSTIPDKFNIYVMAYPTLACLAGLGLQVARERWNLGRRACLVLLTSFVGVPVLAYAGVVAGSKAAGVDLVGARAAPYRDNAVYFMWPPKNGDTGPRRYAAEALASLPPKAYLITDYTLWRPMLLLQRVEGVRPDVELVFVEPLLKKGVDEAIRAVPAERAVYLATDTPAAYYQLERVRAAFTLEREGVVVRVVR